MRVVEQLDIYSQPLVAPDARPATPQQQWERFVRSNPQLPSVLADTAEQLVNLGLRVSINRCFEEVRERIHTRGDTFRLNNTLRAPAARHLMRVYPHLADVFETRRTRR